MNGVSLVDEDPILLYPQLAALIGPNETIVLSQVHYWIRKNEDAGRNLFDGYTWTYNSYRKWQETAFPFWSVDTVKRAIQSLEGMGLLISIQRRQADRSKWYRIDHARLDELRAEAETHLPTCVPPIGADCPPPSGQLAPVLNRDYTETISETTKSNTCDILLKTAKRSRKEVEIETEEPPLEAAPMRDVSGAVSVAPHSVLPARSQPHSLDARSKNHQGVAIAGAGGRTEAELRRWLSEGPLLSNEDRRKRFEARQAEWDAEQERNGLAVASGP